MALLLDTPMGHLVRLVSAGRLCRYPEEQDSFTIPSTCFKIQDIEKPNSDDEIQNLQRRSINQDLEAQYIPRSSISSSEDVLAIQYPKGKSQQEHTVKEKDSRSIDDIVVTWSSPSDPANPRNWSLKKKLWVYFCVNFCTFSMYMSSAIFMPSQLLLPSIFGISEVASTLGIGLFVFGYGFGPLLFSPISDMPAVGRNPPYIFGLVMFIVVSIPAALAESAEVLLIMRFLQGFFGSPVLGTGGASLSDVTKAPLMPYVMYSWAVFSFVAPAVGPIVSGFTVPTLGWRWSLWEILFFAVPVLVCMLFLPETSTPTILHRRAYRLRLLTGDNNLKTAAELEQKNKTAMQIAYSSLVIPWKVNALDPSILFTSIYIGLVYSVYYLFFEACPKVYLNTYGMDVGELGLVFLSVPIATVIVGVPYFAFIRFSVDTRARSQTPVQPEHRLLPGLGGAIMIPVGLFLFAWTSRPEMHWILPTLGIALASGGMALIIQTVFVYIALAYPQYAASLFGGNAFVKSTMALVATLVGPPLYEALGVAGGTSLLGGFCVLCIGGMYILYAYGAELRRRSRFATL